MALLLGKPAVSISHLEKNDALMDEMELGGFRMPLRDLRAGRVIEMLREIESAGAALRRSIQEKVELRRTDIEDQFRRIFEAA
jgi:polysaccharide pyruvyl transferase WcaK-like protein